MDLVIDAVLARAEDDLLAFRMDYLGNYVDMYVVGEALVTFSGEKRQPHFYHQQQNGLLPANVYVKTIGVPDNVVRTRNTVTIQRFIRAEFVRFLNAEWPEEVIFFQDIDEVPSRAQVEEARAIEDREFILSVPMRLYSRRVNWELLAKSGLWYQAKVFRGPVLTNRLRAFLTPRQLRAEPGAHFTQLTMPAEFIIDKFKNYGHQEFNRKEIWTQEFLDFCDLYGVDILGRSSRKGFGLLKYIPPGKLGSVERWAANFRPDWVGPEFSRGLFKRLVMAQLVSDFVLSNSAQYPPEAWKNFATLNGLVKGMNLLLFRAIKMRIGDFSRKLFRRGRKFFRRLFRFLTKGF